MNLLAFNDPIKPHLCSRFGMEVNDVLFFNRNTGDVVYLSQEEGCCSQPDYKLFWTVVRSGISEFYVYCPDDVEAPTVLELVLKMAKVVADEGHLLMRNIYEEISNKGKAR